MYAPTHRQRRHRKQFVGGETYFGFDGFHFKKLKVASDLARLGATGFEKMGRATTSFMNWLLPPLIDRSMSSIRRLRKFATAD
jgi:hypothetical protein